MFGFFRKKAAKPSVSLKDCDKQAQKKPDDPWKNIKLPPPAWAREMDGDDPAENR